MTNSVVRSERRLQEACGDLGIAAVRPTKRGTIIYKVTCRQCKGMEGTTYRSGHPNDLVTAISRWNRHLVYAHPDTPAPPSMAIEAEAVKRGYVFESVKASKRWIAADFDQFSIGAKP